ncbi:hypothetical protein [Actinoallomurus sp. NPDC052274]|uniref:hypothetical protein n=1 Tax=Actinoallomurus sp. NPDC052274 TaxID=3155420 RepID=UPI003432F478
MIGSDEHAHHRKCHSVEQFVDSSHGYGSLEQGLEFLNIRVCADTSASALRSFNTPNGQDRKNGANPLFHPPSFMAFRAALFPAFL